MIFTPIDEFLPELLPHCPTVPKPLARHALRDAANHFCTRTRMWAEWLTINVTAPEVDIAPAHTCVVQADQCVYNKRPISRIALRDADPAVLADTSQATEPSSFIITEDANTLRLYPYKDGAVNLFAILAPVDGPTFANISGAQHQDADNMLPRFLHRKWASVIADGALSDLLMIKGTDFFDPQLAAAFAAKFRKETDNAIGAAYNSSRAGNTNRFVKGHYF